MRPTVSVWACASWLRDMHARAKDESHRQLCLGRVGLGHMVTFCGSVQAVEERVFQWDVGRGISEQRQV